MPWILLSVWMTLLLGVFVDGITLQGVLWSKFNPIFKASNNQHVIEVDLYDEMDFVCPHIAYTNSTESEVYLIYQVQKDEYFSCHRKNVNSPMIVNCSNPKQKKRFTLLFERYSPVPNGMEFQAGESYYYITTSTGYMDGLDKREHGACHHNHMKVTIRVKSHSTSTTTTTTLKPPEDKSTVYVPMVPATTSIWWWWETSTIPHFKTKYPDKNKDRDKDKEDENETFPAKEGHLVSSASSFWSKSQTVLSLGLVMSWTILLTCHR